MSVVEYDTFATFTAVTRKHFNTNVRQTWDNTYEFLAQAPGNTVDLQALAEAIANFERLLMRSSSTLDYVRISTFPSETPASSTDFVDFVFGFAGAQGLGGAQAPLEMCLTVNREPNVGRRGTLAYRNWLVTTEYNSPNGQLTLTDDGWSEAIPTALADSGFTAYVADEAAPLLLVMLSPTGFARTVTALTPRGASWYKLNHKWFDRS